MPLLSDTSRQLAAALTIAAIVIAALSLGQEVLIPFASAALLSFMLEPIVARLISLRLPRGLAVTVVLLTLIGSMVAISAVFSSQMLSLTASLPEYRQNIIGKVRAITGVGRDDGSLKRASDAIESLGKALEKEIKSPVADREATQQTGQVMVAPAAGAPRAADEAAVKPDEKPMVVVKDDNQPWKYLVSIGHPIAAVALTLLFVLFLLLQHNDLRDRLVRIAGTDNLSGTTAAMSDAGERLSRLFLAQAFLNLSFGSIVALALWAIGIPNAMLWGGMTAVLRFVPFIGAFLSAVPPLLLAAAVDPGWTTFGMTLALFLIGEPLMGHVVEPQVLGERAGISPLAMVASASFWTLLWGPVGLILAAPLTMILVVLGRYMPGLEVFTVLLGDEPALTPAQEFYHRLLSGDDIAAGEQLDTSVTEGSLVAASDQVVLPGLLLAVADNRLNRLDREQLKDLGQTMRDVTALLPDIAPQPSDAGAPSPSLPPLQVLVIPARGSVDIAAADFVSGVIGHETAGAITTVTHASGLTALSEAREHRDRSPNVIIIATVGSVEEQQLQFIVARAHTVFPGARILALDYGRRDALPSRSPRVSRTSATEFPVCQRMSDLIAALKAVPRTDGAAAKAERKAAMQDDVSRGTQTDDPSSASSAMLSLAPA